MSIASTELKWAGFLLGFALAGFFDGILLHQILQWHHLLSAVPGEAFRDLRVQVAADGVFHLLMYLIAIAGLALLWRARGDFARPVGSRLLLAYALLGFGAWHVVDAIVFHWTLELHHIRMDTAPLFWDLLWFIVFGVLFVAAGWLLRRRAGTDAGPAGPRNLSTPLLLACATLLAGPIAARPPADAATVLVLYRPGTTTEQIFAGLAAVRGGIAWADPTGALWAIDVGENADTAMLYRHGALLVSRSGVAVGCFSWMRIAASAPGASVN